MAYTGSTADYLPRVAKKAYSGGQFYRVGSVVGKIVNEGDIAIGGDLTIQCEGTCMVQIDGVAAVAEGAKVYAKDGDAKAYTASSGAGYLGVTLGTRAANATNDVEIWLNKATG